jgi:hypothetical protein
VVCITLIKSYIGLIFRYLNYMLEILGPASPLIGRNWLGLFPRIVD